MDENLALGWLPDLPDFRDYSDETKTVHCLFKSVGIFTVYASISQANATGKIPYPAVGENIVGGHAVVAVGYDDTITIKNTNDGVERTGALLIRNSWGTGWGDHGYGWLPYDYVIKQLAIDWWSLIKSEWIDTNVFAL